MRMLALLISTISFAVGYLFLIDGFVAAQYVDGGKAVAFKLGIAFALLLVGLLFLEAVMHKRLARDGK